MRYPIHVVVLTLLVLSSIALAWHSNMLPNSLSVVPPISGEDDGVGKVAVIASGAAKNAVEREVFDGTVLEWKTYLQQNGWEVYSVGYNEAAIGVGLKWLAERSSPDTDMGFFYVGHGNHLALYLGAARLDDVPRELEYTYGVELGDVLDDFFDENVTYNNLVVVMDHSLAAPWAYKLDGPDRIIITGSGTYSAPRQSMLHVLRVKMGVEGKTLEEAFSEAQVEFEEEYGTTPRISDGIDGDYTF